MSIRLKINSEIKSLKTIGEILTDDVTSRDIEELLFYYNDKLKIDNDNELEDNLKRDLTKVTNNIVGLNTLDKVVINSDKRKVLKSSFMFKQGSLAAVLW